MQFDWNTRYGDRFRYVRAAIVVSGTDYRYRHRPNSGRAVSQLFVRETVKPTFQQKVRPPGHHDVELVEAFMATMHAMPMRHTSTFRPPAYVQDYHIGFYLNGWRHTAGCSSRHNPSCTVLSSGHHECDFLIVDGTNVMCMAQSGASEHQMTRMFLPPVPLSTSSAPTPSLRQARAASFQAWLRFIRLAASPRAAAFVIFDSGGGGGQPNHLRTAKSDVQPSTCGGQNSEGGVGRQQASFSAKQEVVPDYLRQRHEKRDRRQRGAGGRQSVAS